MNQEPTDEQSETLSDRQRCLKKFSAILSENYRVVSELTDSPGIHRFLAHDHEDQKPCLVVIRDYSREMSDHEIELQKSMVEAIENTTSVQACPIRKSSLEKHGHFIVSELQGTRSLFQILKQQRRFEFSQVVGVLRELVSGLDTATRNRWPKVEIDLHTLFLADRNDKLFIPVSAPPLPGPETIADGTGVPINSGVYVEDLGRISCSMLGMATRGGRFRPIAELGEERNYLLQMIVESGCGNAFFSASEFVDHLEAGTVPNYVKHYVPPAREKPGVSQTESDRTTTGVGSGDQEIDSAGPIYEPGDLGSLQDPIESDEDETSSGVPQFRLIPGSSSQSVISLCTSDALVVGRNNNADFVAKFSSQNPRSDELSSLISREHFSFQIEGDQIFGEESQSANLSFVGGKPLSGRRKFSKDSRIMLAGEYELLIRFTPSSWGSDGNVWSDEDSEEKAKLTGALVFSPGKLESSINCSTAWVFTDVAFGVDAAEKFKLGPSRKTDRQGAFLRRGEDLYVVAFESDGFLVLNGEPLDALKPVLLTDGAVLKIGKQAWKVKPYERPSKAIESGKKPGARKTTASKKKSAKKKTTARKKTAAKKKRAPRKK